MTTQRRTVLVIATLAVAAVICGVVYSRTRGSAPDDIGAKVDDPPLPAPVTKATAPARKLNDKERMLVGTWKFEKVTPARLGGGFQATYVFGTDGSFTFWCSKTGAAGWGRRGKYRITIDHVVMDPEEGETVSNLIEELSDDRFVESAFDGREQWVKEWSRVRQ